MFKVWGSAAMMAGLPDLICCYRGLFLALETKMPGKESNVSARQQLVHGWIRRSGGYVAIVTSREEALDALDSCIKHFHDLYGVSTKLSRDSG